MSGTTAVWNLLQRGMEIARILQVAVGKERTEKVEMEREEERDVM
jgi:hypothetical protein